MNAVFSFNSYPFLTGEIMDLDLFHTTKGIGGFTESKYYFMSTVLAILQAKKFFNKVHLYTDDFGWKLLEPLGIKYDYVFKDLNKIISQKENERFWSISKIKVHLMQKEPYVHIDNDLYFWKEIPTFLEKADVLAAWSESKLQFYEYEVNDYLKNGDKNLLPKLTNYINKNRSFIPGVNCGIVGGKNIKFLNEYAKDCIYYINECKENYFHLSSCFFIEQYYLGAKCIEDKIKCLTYTDIAGPKLSWENNEWFAHMYGHSKATSWGQNLIESNFNNLFPEYLNKVEKAVKNFEQIKKNFNNI